MDLKLIKFVNGDEIIAEVLDKYDTGMVIRRPMTLHLQQREDGSVGANFIPALIMTERNEMVVPYSAIMMEGSPDEQFEKQYLQITSGIALA